ncbi:MAG TPA: PIG-L deacetylase family protein [Acidimicrobiia bacterium]|nr:PIG-L deacetylase family protein [Acidimicrobiia bacterium]
MTSLYTDAAAVTRPERLPVPARALTIGAHPDDAEFGAGGTLAAWARGGCEISMLVVTDGSKGSWDPEASAAALASARLAEQVAAARALGATGELIHLGYVDGELEYTMELRRQLCEWIRRLRPQVVLSHDPWRRYMLHPDHRATGFGAIDGVVAARDHLFFPELGLEKHRPEAVLLWAADEPDYWEDVAATFDIKIEALLCHSSQTRTTMNDAHNGEESRLAFVTRMREWCGRQGEGVGLALAESFKLLRP